MDSARMNHGGKCIRVLFYDVAKPCRRLQAKAVNPCLILKATKISSTAQLLDIWWSYGAHDPA